ncbi:ChbG/HpnK family deacetylase [Pedobacter sp. SAFR-022]|uniref:ChbG/HpnK family deacetylase n=1 Tax=Pedobacter sp. SAFR-022 TaxID=3436861 RepID=UPI003F7FACE1
MKKHFLFLMLLIGSLHAVAQSASGKLPKVLLRFDDIGMNHAVNTAIDEVGKTGIPFSASVMFACPWYQEAVEVLKKYPNVAVGVHLTLTAEWKNYRWGPVLGQSAVPSLVDSLGYFLPSTTAFQKNKYKLEEVERELSAQIERAISSGLQISYIDPHMGIALSTPELRSLTEKLAKKYKLGISPLSEVTYFGEAYNDMWGEPVATKKQAFMKVLENLSAAAPANMVILHIAQATPEMDAMTDMNSSMMSSNASSHRQTELDMVLSKDFQEMVGKQFELVTYRDLIKQLGLRNQKTIPAGK